MAEVWQSESEQRACEFNVVSSTATCSLTTVLPDDLDSDLRADSYSHSYSDSESNSSLQQQQQLLVLLPTIHDNVVSGPKSKTLS